MELVPYEFAKRHGLFWDPPRARLCLRPDFDPAALGEIQRALGRAGSLETLAAEDFASRLEELYGAARGRTSSLLLEAEGSLDLDAAAARLEESGDLLAEDDAPVVRFLNAVIAEALRARASDVHIEPHRDAARIRYRIDGVLHTALTPPPQLVPLLAARIKVMAGLDISEKRNPQDGRVRVQLAGRSVDLRVSTLPASGGERVVLRLLDPHAVRPSLDQLGLGAAQRAALARLVAQPHGMVLVTGPTGSGKTTTLYALLGELDRERLNVMTVEDPVEYELPGVSQTQINLRAGMTFARGLRAILRQDPDVVLIGEIRDPETAQIAVQASLTGHLLLSTLHTNTALGAVTRLRDLGVADFLLAATLRGLVAQRLVRRLCPHCRRPQTLGPAEAQLAGLPAGSGAFRAAGCPQCSHTGYAGRCALVEVVELDETLCRLIHEGAGEAELERQVRDRLPSLRQEGFRLVAAGVTSIEEVLRATVD